MAYIEDEVRPNGQSHLSLEEVKLLLTYATTFSLFFVDFTFLSLMFVHFLVKENVMGDPFTKPEMSFYHILSRGIERFKGIELPGFPIRFLKNAIGKMRNSEIHNPDDKEDV